MQRLDPYCPPVVHNIMEWDKRRCDKRWRGVAFIRDGVKVRCSTSRGRGNEYYCQKNENASILIYHVRMHLDVEYLPLIVKFTRQNTCHNWHVSLIHSFLITLLILLPIPPYLSSSHTLLKLPLAPLTLPIE